MIMFLMIKCIDFLLMAHLLSLFFFLFSGVSLFFFCLVVNCCLVYFEISRRERERDRERIMSAFNPFDKTSSNRFSELCLKTASGRTCVVAPPFTVDRVIDAAVQELHMQRESVKLYSKGQQICAQGSVSVCGTEIKMPEDGYILIVGKPQRSMGRLDSVGKTTSTGSKTFVTGLSENENVQAKRPLTTSVEPSCLRIYTGFLRKDLYFYLKSFVFMNGWNGLHDMVKRRDPDIFRHLRSNSTIVSIVEYVDRDPSRLKEVLISIKEEEPWFFRWIENNTEFFLDVINTPPSRKDDKSPIWLIRQAKEVYGNEIAIQRGAAPIFQGSNKFWCLGEMPHRLPSSQETHNGVTMTEKRPKLTVPKTQRPGERVNSGAKSFLNSAAYPTEALNNQILYGSLSDPPYAEAIKEDASRRAAMEKWATASSEAHRNEYANEIAVQLHRTNAAYLCVLSSSIEAVGKFVMLPKELVEMVRRGWRESEYWFAQRNDAKGALECALGILLFNLGEEVIASRASTGALLNPAVRWITSEGPRLLLQELQYYSSCESLSVVIYSKVSSNCAYAYVVKGNSVSLSPILMDETADREYRDLERFYTIVARKPTLKKATTLKKSLWNPWISLVTGLYKRFISPIEALLPPPAHNAGDNPAAVGQVCFIHTWASKEVPIPFAALRHPESGESCVLRWALFMASHPWHLVLSKSIPWSSATLDSPVITRFADPIRMWPGEHHDSQESEGPVEFASNVTTYLHTKGTGYTRLNKDAKTDESYTIWKDVPWAPWIKSAIGVTHSALPPLASLQGRGEPPNKTTALLIHEVARGPDGGTHSTIPNEGVTLFAQRSAPYNQSADLFVSSVFGRESGVGVHRAALISMYRVAGRIPTDTYQMFFRGLIATGDMTAARAYRLALLMSWKGECKDEPWRSACIGLFNYGGPMRTLNAIHGRYQRQPQFQSKSTSLEKDQGSDDMVSGSRPAYRSTPGGRYIERHAIDAIFEVILQEVTARQPIGEVAILDCLIETIETNKTKLQTCVEVRQRTKRNPKAHVVVSATEQKSTIPASVSLPLSENVRGAGVASKFVATKRNLVSGGNWGAPSTALPNNDKRTGIAKIREPPGKDM